MHFKIKTSDGNKPDSVLQQNARHALLKFYIVLQENGHIAYVGKAGHSVTDQGYPLFTISHQPS